MTTQAKHIINGFMSVFPAPECREQQEVVDAANKWLAEYAEIERKQEEFLVLVREGGA